MDYKAELDKIKKVLFGEATPVAPVAPVSAAKDYTLADGSTVTISDLSVGGTVMVNGEAASAGDYTLEDGTLIRVDATGAITEVVAKQEEQAPDFGSQFSEFQNAFNTHKQEFSDYKIQAEQRFASQDEIIKKQQEGFGQLLEIVENLSKTPSANPAEAPKNVFTKAVTREDQLAKLQQNLKTLRTQQ